MAELDPGSTSSDYDAAIGYWRMVDAILGGAPTMRAAGETYLPRFQNEQETKDTSGQTFDPYEVRRCHAPFTNIYADNSQTLASKPFAKEMKVKAGASYEKLAEDIDGHGNNFHVFGADCFKRGLDKAIDWVLVDYTKAVPRPDGLPLSRADEAAQGLRPYWVNIPAERMIAVYSDFVSGRETIYHARFRENITTVEDFKEKCVERVREFWRDRIIDAVGKTIAFGQPQWRLWEKAENGWAVVDQGAVTIGVIPLVPFIAGSRKGSSWQIEPPLKTIAYMQIEEYQQESNLKNLIDLTCYPMLTGNGVSPPDDGVVPVGPRAVLFAPMGADGTVGSWQFIEPGAESIQKVMDRLDKTQTMMRDLGAQPMMSANLTVVMSNQQAVKANSQVQAWAFKFKDAMEQCWKLTALWLGQSDEPEVEVFTDFSIDFQDSAEMAELNTAQQQGVISKRLLFAEYQRRGMISENADFDKDQESAASDDILPDEDQDAVVTPNRRAA